jgi:hypothetical protein
MKIIVKKPKELKTREIEIFLDLVCRHSKIYLEGLQDRIEQAALLSLAVKDNEILAVRAIKRPGYGYIREIGIKSNISNLRTMFKFETGWSVTLPEHRCKGISGMLLKSLLQTVNNNVYSITRVSNIAPQKILTKNGFVRSGIEFSGIEEPLCVWLYYRQGGVAPWL